VAEGLKQFNEFANEQRFVAFEVAVTKHMTGERKHLGSEKN
jgi:hypothetical protein